MPTDDALGDPGALPLAGSAALVVDPDEFFRIAFSAVLERRFGAERILEAASFDAALAIMRGERELRLVIFDAATPGLPEPAGLGSLRDADPRLLVVMMANEIDREQVLDTLEAGLHGFLCKSDGLAAITAGLSAVLSGSIHVPVGMAQRPRGQLAPARAVLRENLTGRQLDVLRLLVAGQTNKEIARTLQLGEGTVKAHVAALLRILKVNNRAAAAVTGVRILSAA